MNNLYIMDAEKCLNELLQETGILFVSIYDNKLIKLRMICNAIFGKDNFIGIFITRQATRSNAKFINTIHEYVVVFARNKKKSPKFEINRLDIPFYTDRLQLLMNEIRRESSRRMAVLVQENYLRYDSKILIMMRIFLS